MATQVEAPQDRSDWGNSHLNRLADAVSELQGIANGGSQPLSVLSYNAKGDGVTDDTVAIQAALTAAHNAGGGYVYVPTTAVNNYLISASLIIYSNTKLELHPAVTITLKAGSSCNMIHNAAWVAGGSGRDSNIEICGRGTWDAGNNSGGVTPQATYTMLLQRVDSLRVSGFFMASTGGKYAIDLYACTNFEVNNIRFNHLASDGVHIEGLSRNGRITNISGVVGDDSVALTPANYTANQNGDLGDITDILIENVDTTNSNGTAGVALLAGSNAGGGTAYNIKRVRIANVRVNSTGPGVRVGGDATNASTQGGNIYDVEVTQVQNTGSGPAALMMNMGAATEAAGIEFSHLYNQAATAALAFDGSGSAITVRDVTLRNCQFIAPNVGISPIKVNSAAVIEHFSISDIQYTFATSTFLVQLVNAGATINALKFSRIRLRGSTFGGGLVTVGPGLTLTALHAENITVDQCGYPLGDIITTTSIFARGISCPSGNISALVFNRAGCSITFRELLGLDTAANLYALGSSGTVAGAYLAGVGRKAALTYSASITPDLIKADMQTITVTDTVAFTVNAPINPPAAAQNALLTIEVLNSSGGVMGAITWNAAFIFTVGAWTNPASTKKRSITFRWSGTQWIQISPVGTDY